MKVKSIYMENKDYVLYNINKILETEMKNRLNIKQTFLNVFNRDLIWHS